MGSEISENHCEFAFPYIYNLLASLHLFLVSTKYILHDQHDMLLDKESDIKKVKNIEKLKPDIISTGNIGCITQISSGTKIPILHTVEIIDWCTGGPKPEILRNL